MGVLSASQALLLMTHLQERERLRRQPDLLQGRRADGAGPVWPASPTWRSPPWRRSSPHIRSRQAAGARHHRRDAHADRCPTRRRSASRASKAYPTYSWWGIYAPAGTPRPIVDRMNAEIAKAVRSPDVTPKLVDPDRHGNPRQLARGVRRLPEESSRNADQDHRGERHQGH